MPDYRLVPAKESESCETFSFEERLPKNGRLSVKREDPLDYDVVIVGAGPVGAVLALALSALPLRIAIIDAKPLTHQTQSDFSCRAIALSHSSQHILSALKLWDRVVLDATPINTIHVSSRFGFGVTNIKAKEQGVDALGHVVIAKNLQANILRQLEDAPVDIFSPAHLTALSNERDGVTITMNGEEEKMLTAQLVVGADGGHSTVRQLCGIATHEEDYCQHAIVATLGLARSHKNVAYERFTPGGPLAMLPLKNNKESALVWSVPSEEVDKWKDADDHTFISAVQERIGYRVGKIDSVGKRFCFPLRKITADRLVTDRVVLLGNAANHLHPVAGQGLNLGLRDVGVLVDLIEEAILNGKKIDSHDVLQRYAAHRKPDQKSTALLSDTLVKVFSNRQFPLTWLRHTGLLLGDVMPFFKATLSRRAMGFSGKSSYLANGVRRHEK